MTVADVQKKYTGPALSNFPGDDALRYEAFAPLFQNLHNNSVIYSERGFYAVVTVSDLVITPQSIEAVAEIRKKIERPPFQISYPQEPWHFRAQWGALRLIGNQLNVPYAGFTIWPEPEMVVVIENLVDAQRHDEAYALLHAD